MRRARWDLGVALVGGLALGGLAAGCFSEHNPAAPAEAVCRLPAGEGVPGSIVVPIADFAFSPAEVRIHAGQTVTWVNCEEDATSHTTHANGEEWASPLLAPGQAFSHQFDQAGTFDYHCDPHPFMTGRVIVE